MFSAVLQTFWSCQRLKYLESGFLRGPTEQSCWSQRSRIRVVPGKLSPRFLWSISWFKSNPNSGENRRLSEWSVKEAKAPGSAPMHYAGKEKPLLLSQNGAPCVCNFKPRRRPTAVRDDAITSQTLHGGDVARPPETTKNQNCSFQDPPHLTSSFFFRFNINRLPFSFFCPFLVGALRLPLNKMAAQRARRPRRDGSSRL